MVPAVKQSYSITDNLCYVNLRLGKALYLLLFSALQDNLVERRRELVLRRRANQWDVVNV